MKKLNLSAVTPTIGFPSKKGTWDFLQSSYQEVFNNILIGMIIERTGSYTSSNKYVLYGCESTNLGGSHSFSYGAVFYNGEVYTIPTQTVADPSGGDVFVVNLSVSQYSSGTEADPVTFTDLINRNVHDIRNGVYSTGITGTIGVYSDFINVFKNNIEYRSNFNGDTIGFTGNKTIFYDYTNSSTATPSVFINLVNALVGCKIICAFRPSSSSSIVFTSITETGASVVIIDKIKGVLPTISTSFVYVEYEYVGYNLVAASNYVLRTITYA